MSAISIIPYNSSLEKAWNAFNNAAVNGHFLFDRGFMNYHEHRFTDASLMLLREGEVAALFPANLVEDRMYSHQGLTFGGLVHGDNLRLTEILEMFDTLKDHARSLGAREIVYKAMPAIYNRAPADDVLYALFRNRAVCRVRDATTTIDYREPGPRSNRRRRAVRKSCSAGLELVWDDGWDEYWSILAEVLMRRHCRTPVHSPDELRLLAQRFPDCIKLFAAKKGGVTVAGVVMFETPYVAHAQYIAAGPSGQELRALDAILNYLIDYYAGTKRYFDFGISTENGGWHLNAGLADYKQEWGGGYVVHDTYHWSV